MSGRPKDLVWENYCVVAAVQALLFLIAPSVEAVALHVDEDELVFRYWTLGSRSEIEEDADDLMFEMAAQIDRPPLLVWAILPA